jgi:hypothetical protein
LAGKKLAKKYSNMLEFLFKFDLIFTTTGSSGA